MTKKQKYHEKRSDPTQAQGAQTIGWHHEPSTPSIFQLWKGAESLSEKSIEFRNSCGEFLHFHVSDKSCFLLLLRVVFLRFKSAKVLTAGNAYTPWPRPFYTASSSYKIINHVRAQGTVQHHRAFTSPGGTAQLVLHELVSSFKRTIKNCSFKK